MVNRVQERVVCFPDTKTLINLGEEGWIRPVGVVEMEGWGCEVDASSKNVPEID